MGSFHACQIKEYPLDICFFRNSCANKVKRENINNNILEVTNENLMSFLNSVPQDEHSFVLVYNLALALALTLINTHSHSYSHSHIHSSYTNHVLSLFYSKQAYKQKHFFTFFLHKKMIFSNFIWIYSIPPLSFDFSTGWTCAPELRKIYFLPEQSGWTENLERLFNIKKVC